MALFYPNLNDIEKLKQKPTQGELHVLNTLKSLSDEYEVYFQPFINGNNPDIIVMREDYSVLIIEVKDWNLRNYDIDKGKDIWTLSKDDTEIKSPIKQVIAYKDDLYNLSIPSLLDRKIKDKKHYGIVQTALYFHNENSASLKKLIKTDGFCPVYGRNNLTKENLKKYSFRNYKNKLFSHDVYKEFHRILKPSLHTLEQTKEVVLSKKQEQLAQSSIMHKKIKGVAGSGKTMVLAQRAVNSHLRHGNKVLILTFNITLRNYIHDHISRVGKEFSWDKFHIIHYHAFIAAEANNHQIADFDVGNIELFERVKGKITKYNSIFIDEIQDYKAEWVRIIKNYFLAEDGEFVVFGDGKQNIYNRPLTNNHLNTTIIGAWSKLNQSHRLSNKILNIVEKFQNEFFSEKYELDKAVPKKQQSLDLEESTKSTIDYHDFSGSTPSDLSSFILDKCKKYSIQPQDVCVLACTNELLRDIDYEIRKTTRQKTFTTFETLEMHQDLMKSNNNDTSAISADVEIENIRRNKRFNFWMNAGGMKLSTVHGFKGWEIDTVFFIIDDSSHHGIDEIIYTGLTRCRNRLFILNVNNKKYGDFFTKVLTENETPALGNDVIYESSVDISLEKKEDKTLEQIEDVIENVTKDNISSFRYKFYDLFSNGKFNMLILGEMSASKDKTRESLNNYFSKYGIRPQEWDVDFWSNKDIKNKDIKSLKRGQSKYDLLITAQIHQHSSKGSKQGNLLTELTKPQYVTRVYGSKPKKILTVDALIDKLGEYIQRKT